MNWNCCSLSFCLFYSFCSCRLKKLTLLRTRVLKHKVQRSSISKTNNYLFMSLCLSVFLSFCLSTSLPLYLSVCLFMTFCLSVFQSLSIATALLNVAKRQPPYIETVVSEIRESWRRFRHRRATGATRSRRSGFRSRASEGLWMPSPSSRLPSSRLSARRCTCSSCGARYRSECPAEEKIKKTQINLKLKVMQNC